MSRSVFYARGRVAHGPFQPVRVALCALVLAASPSHIRAQSTVRSVDLSADLSADDGSALVHVQYVIVLDGDPAVRFELLGFGDASVDAFRSGGEAGRGFRLQREDGAASGAGARTRDFWSALIEADDFERAGFQRGRIEPLAGAGPRLDPGTGAVWRIDVEYEVQRAVARNGQPLRVHVPVLTIALPPAQNVGTVFHAQVRIPAAWSISEGFPTGLRAREEGTYVVDLPVAPAVVSLRARADGAWRPGLPLLLDILAGLILIAFAVVGWRHLRAQAAAAETATAR